VFYLIRNRWLFILRDYSLRTLIVLAPVLCLYEMAQLALALKKGWVGAWLRAAGSAIYRLPETLARRRLIQSERRRSDADLLTGGPIPFRAELTSSRLEMWAKRTLDDLTAVYWRAVEGWL